VRSIIDKKVNTDFEIALKREENGIRKGYDKKTGRWFPHESLEGGAPTIGYGHKVKAHEDFSKGLTQYEVDQLFLEDIKIHKDIVIKAIGKKPYDDLPEKYRCVLINIAFNTGRFRIGMWPKLITAMQQRDDYGVRREMVTSYKDPRGDRHKLQTRATNIADALNLKKEKK